MWAYWGCNPHYLTTSDPARPKKDIGLVVSFTSSILLTSLMEKTLQKPLILAT